VIRWLSGLLLCSCAIGHAATVEYLVVGGGGGGGAGALATNNGGGGGGGGCRTDSLVVVASTISVVVGTGGTAGTITSRGSNGGDSQFGSIVAAGGGAGGGGASASKYSPLAGGNGGGGDYSFTLNGAAGNTPAKTPAQGFSGGNRRPGSPFYAGGGGGCAQAGSSTVGTGGNGLSSSISGTAKTYGGGGAGAQDNGPSSGGAGGGGNGGKGASPVVNPTAGTDNLGGGGGGGSSQGGVPGLSGAKGGSGIVIVRYKTNGSDGIDATATTGGTKTTSGAYTVHTFTSSGTFTVVTNVVPLAEYRFDQSGWNGTAGEVIDSTGNGNSAVAVNGASTAPGLLCNAGTFNGTNQFLRLPNTANLNFGPGVGFTLTTWIKTTDAYGGIVSLRNTGDGGTVVIDLSLGYNGAVTAPTGGQFIPILRDNSNTIAFFSTGPVVNDGSWHFLAITYDGSSTFTSYVDGVSAGSKALAAKGGFTSFGVRTIGTEGYWQFSNFTTPDRQFITGLIDEFKLFKVALTSAQISTLYSNEKTGTTNWDGTPRACQVVAPHHLEIQHASGTGLTCTPSTVTVKACADAACTTAYTSGVSGTLGATGGSVVWPDTTAFSIPAGSSTTTVRLQATTTTPTVLGVSSSSPAASNAATCDFGSPACTFTAADAGFVFSVPDHVSEVAQSVSVSAVRKSDNSTACTPAFASTSKAVTFRCSYTNPATGTLPVRVGGSALNSGGSAAAACDAGGRSVSLAFNASGVASTTLQYADVGNMSVAATYTGSSATGDAGLSMSGASTFIAAPKDFVFSNVTSGPIKAGNNFGATVTARNAIAAATPNFGKETIKEGVTLSFTKYRPTGTASVNGSFSGSVGLFSSGSASGSNFTWSEVGTIDLTADLASGSYLGSGLSASGTTGSAGAVGRFIPDHFDTVVTQGCTSGSFTYSGQPFTTQVTARNLAGNTTQNYDGTINTSPNFAKVTTLSNAGSATNFSNNTLLTTNFSAGVGVNSTVTYTFPVVKTAPLTMNMRAQDTDGVVSGLVEGPVSIRSGRLQMQNAHGSELLALQVPLVAQYWTGNYFATNNADSCTAIPMGSIVMSNYLKSLVACRTQISPSGTVTMVSGKLPGTGLVLSAPAAGYPGSVNLSLNIGTTATGSTCVSSSQSSAVAANRPWFGANPTARATFGIYKSPVIFRRENY
jgi:MSHA biogenesis protein MshQ